MKILRKEEIIRPEMVKEKLLKIVRIMFEHANVEIDMIEYADWLDDLGMDSMIFISIIIEIEKEFGITVPDDMLLMENFRNVNDVVQMITGQMVGNIKGAEDENNDKA